MKPYAAISVTLLQLIASGSNAQVKAPRPKLFNGVENTITYPRTELEKIFTRDKGSNYHVSLPGNFKFDGTVVSSVHQYNNLKSFLIKSDALDGAMFIISRRVNDDNSITFVGRIINEKYSDGYELKSDAAGNYYLSKIQTDDTFHNSQATPREK